jgi:hypothetical protein
MPCLLSRTQLQEWGATMRLGDGHIQFDKLGRAGAMDTHAHTGHLLLDLMQFDMDKLQSGEELHEFRLGAEEALVIDEEVAINCANETTENADVRPDAMEAETYAVKDAIVDGKWHAAIPSNVRRRSLQRIEEIVQALRC